MLALPEDLASRRSQVLAQHLRRARGLFHLGAHLGQEAASYAARDLPVVWVEALPALHARLQQNVARWPRQRALCALLDEVDGRQRHFHISNNDEGVSSSLFPFGSHAQGPSSLWPELGLQMVGSITLPGLTLDTLLAANGVSAAQHDTWILDLQGAELLALRGATRSLEACVTLLVEVSQVPVYEGGVLWPELKAWLEARGFVPLWEPVRPHDDVLFVRESSLDRVRREFQSDHYLRHNARRLEHLASLGLPLQGKRVLEVGAGIGDHTSFYLDRGCHVTVTEVRPENLLLLRRRFGTEPKVAVAELDMDRPAWPPGERFDLVHCYGLLYHLSQPEQAVRFLASMADTLLLETCLSPTDEPGPNPLPEPAELASQAFHGTGCRPALAWLQQLLSRHYRDVSLPPIQPSHPEFDRDHALAKGGLFRRVFVASGPRPL